MAGCVMVSFHWWDQRFGVGFQLSCGLKLWIWLVVVLAAGWSYGSVFFFFFFIGGIYVLCFWSSGSPQSWAQIGVTGFGGVVGFSVGFGMKNSCGQRGYMVRIGSGFSLQISWGKKLRCIGLQISWGKYLSNGMSGDWVISDGECGCGLSVVILVAERGDQVGLWYQVDVGQPRLPT